jgi:hypothetical protein
MALKEVTNLPSYKAQATLDFKDAPVIQRGKFLHEIPTLRYYFIEIIPTERETERETIASNPYIPRPDGKSYRSF